MPLNAAQRKRALRERLSPRRPSRLRRAIAVSVAIHVGILLMLLVVIKQKGREEYLPPPSPVTMVFQSGRKEGPTLPEPSPQASQPKQAAPAEEPPLPVPPAPPPPPPPPPPPTPAVPPAPVPVPPAVEAPPLPPPVEKAPAEHPPPAPKPPPKRPPPPKPSDFPAPMNFSFGKPLGAVRPRPRTSSSAQRAPGSVDMSLGPAHKGPANISPFADIDTDEGGPDWRNALAAWVSQHAYYPEQARNNGEDGDVRVHVVAQHNGRVTEVELISKSGSMWLDLALQSMFRDAHIPPLPTPGNEPIEFNFTMHYILRRVP